MSRQVAIVIETTGYSVNDADRVIEIACVELIDGALSGVTRQFYLNPERKCSQQAFKVHGISDAFLRDKPRFKEVSGEITSFIMGAEVILYHAKFDGGFLNMELARAGVGELGEYAIRVIDVRSLAEQKFPGEKNTLTSLCARYAVKASEHGHVGATLDAALLATVYERMRIGHDMRYLH